MGYQHWNLNSSMCYRLCNSFTFMPPSLFLSIRESEDTVLLILKEIYGLMGLAPTRQVTSPQRPPLATFPRHPLAASPQIPSPQQRPAYVPSTKPVPQPGMGMTPPMGTSPARPPTGGGMVGPPPRFGFVKK